MKIRILLLILSVLLASNSFAAETFRNPIITGMNPDPSITRVGDDYYLVTSTFEYFPGLPVYKSKDLVNWKLISYAVASKTSNPLMGTGASGGQYAPTIRYHDGLFYVVGTNYAGLGGFYVTAKDPEGPWSEPVWVNNWLVDPSILFADGKVYWHSPDRKGDFAVGEIDMQTGEFTKPLRAVAKGQGGSSPEGPHLYKINGYYYLLSAEGGTGYEHRAVVQRSKSPYGPYEASPINPMASHMNHPDNPFQAIGHADLVETPDGWWMVCLGIRPQGGKFHHLGRETFLAPVTWDENGWPKVGLDGVVKEEYPLPKLPWHEWEKEPVRDDFGSDTLRLSWNFLRNPYDADWSLVAKKGYLRLNGSAVNFTGKDSPAYVTRRQTAFDMVASTKVSFVPTADNEEAGLVIRGNDENHYDFVITQRGDDRVVMLRQYLNDKVAATDIRKIVAGDAILRISATPLEYKFWVQQKGKPAQLVGTALTKNISTEKIQGFTGVFIGMYASGNGRKNANPADFDWFDYEENPAIPYAWVK